MRGDGSEGSVADGTATSSDGRSAAFDRTVLGGLSPLSFGLAVLYAAYIVFDLLEVPAQLLGHVVGLKALMVAVFLALGLALRRQRIPPRWAHPVGVGVAMLVLASLLVTFFLVRDTAYVSFVLVLVMGCGFFLLSYRWLVVVLGVCTLGWIAMTEKLFSPGFVPFAPPSEVLHFGLPLFVAMVVAVVICVAHRRSVAIGVAELERRREVERSQRQSEERLEMAIAGSKGGWWDIVMDPQKPTEIPDRAKLSPDLKGFLGYADHEFPDSFKAWNEHILPADAELVEESRRQHLDGSTPVHEAEFRIQHRTGEIRWISSRGRLQRDADGRPIRFSGIAWDVTRTKRDEEQIVKLSRAVEQSSSILIITDSEGAIEYVNPKFTQVTGYSAEEALGRNPRFLRSGETPSAVYEGLWQTITMGGEWQGELKNLTKTGEPVWVLVSISPIRNREGVITHYLGVQEDITERKQVEARLLQGQKMESVGQLVSAVAHDFNNLLTSILGFAELMTMEIAAEDPKAEYAREIHSAALSAASLTKQLLAFSRQQVLEPRVVDLNGIVTSIETLLRHGLTEEIDLAFVLAPELGRVRADPGQVKQILLNLVVNARDAMPEGGRLTIETANTELSERYTAGRADVAPGSYVVLAVSDTGCGMSEEIRGRVFDPFFTTKKRGHGTGLGLSTVYGIVTQSGGYVWAYSEPGEGATFKVYLPRVEEPAEPIERQETEGRDKSGSETVLLVEDDAGVRQLAQEVLSGGGYKVLTAVSAEHALEVFEKNKDSIELLLTDVVMPGENGVGLADTIRQRRDGVKILLFSGYAEQAIRRNQLADSQIPFLSKPFRAGQLLRKVREVLEGPASGLVSSAELPE